MSSNTKIKVKDLTVEELKKLIKISVQESMSDLIEDVAAFSDPSYINSIKEARGDYKKGCVKSLTDAFNA